jgi:hypothetical protein
MYRLLGLLLLACASPAWAQGESAPILMEPEAIELLEAAASHLAKSKTFRMRSRISYDSIQEDGEKLEFGASRNILIARPDKARIETRHRDGRHTVLIIDGERLWLYTPAQRAYGSAPQPGDIGASLEFVARELGVPQPLSDLLVADPYQVMAEGLTSAMIVGDSEIDGVACLHAAYRNDVGDFQLWVSRSEHQIQRLVISYRNQPGQPQFRADLEGFDPQPKIGPETFAFSPPEDAERLRFIVNTKPHTEEE